MKKITLNEQTRFVHEPEALKGAVIAARNVIHDMELIFGEPLRDFDGLADAAVIYGTVGSSPIIDTLAAEVFKEKLMPKDNE